MGFVGTFKHGCWVWKANEWPTMGQQQPSAHLPQLLTRNPSRGATELWRQTHNSTADGVLPEALASMHSVNTSAECAAQLAVDCNYVTAQMVDQVTSFIWIIVKLFTALKFVGWLFVSVYGGLRTVHWTIDRFYSLHFNFSEKLGSIY